ncbi:MAG TPA: type II toxin-antitoxin system Phd/YefM family antitoxin [Gordonia sp. (in: high G+C Gram-positive bacteria)]|uniref:type II toxin-antitoxin system Phd/YefM family antitoxin n=1 Tax=unclassified Gordonia (in: high G+C Gram-positive bacteria) TaxID=2657482 RepID=UPI000FBD86D6|nr:MULTISPECIES: type II toxin-antitoxin system Phd/YefM family antitoxin [unclassified Gordonia (in: high G+C Gram-positive bacteria)]RUP39504.1 MAG: type II toxin-antitoxin system Phd/YefM family antitoxin [Gordonia sp. (in: high G+C Gram-positive bacteria)]HNP57587.1 type II toxin-antitoxin system Phd/YefM family antitoxin [Gordonia sp. (in: high G+C Gram-positive bacteria)]HRC49578.1 type II toxin-antitoxin system Phd/YefM family antitoxin [Gordonia sp. (in: high G+C Gram-positive bacteria)]
MTTVNIFEAKASFSKLIAAAEAGETIVIARNGKPVARLGPIDPVTFPPAKLGDLAGQFTVPDDFDEWTADDDALWYGDGQDSRQS